MVIILKQYFGYIRVSSKKQDENFTFETQKYKIIEYAKRLNLQLGKIFYDVGSGNQINPELIKLLAIKKDMAGLIIYDQSRLTRNPKDLFYLQENLIDVEIHTISGVIDWGTPEGLFYSDMIGVASKYERLKIIQRTKHAYEKNMKLDKPNPGKKTRWGRPKKINDAAFDKYYHLYGLRNKTSLAKLLKVSRKTVYDYMIEKGLYTPKSQEMVMKNEDSTIKE